MNNPTIFLNKNGIHFDAGCLQSHLSDDSNIAMRILKSTPATSQGLPCIHEGFKQSYSKIRKELFECVMKVYKRQFEKSLHRWNKNDYFSLPKIYVTGHSLGGSLGQIFALDLSCNFAVFVDSRVAQDDPTMQTSTLDEINSSFIGELLSPYFSANSSFYTENEEKSIDHEICFQPPLGVYTFGQTRVGNRVFAKLYKSRVPHTFRVCVEGDALTSQPIGVCTGGYWYKHAGLEAVLDEGRTGNILVGPTVVETLLRFSKVRTSLDAHSMNRYRDCLESAFTHDELKEYYQGHIDKGVDIMEKDFSANISKRGSRSDLPSWVTQIKR